MWHWRKNVDINIHYSFIMQFVEELLQCSHDDNDGGDGWRKVKGIFFLIISTNFLLRESI
jgi:hypothetical protein